MYKIISHPTSKSHWDIIEYLKSRLDHNHHNHDPKHNPNNHKGASCMPKWASTNKTDLILSDFNKTSNWNVGVLQSKGLTVMLTLHKPQGNSGAGAFFIRVIARFVTESLTNSIWSIFHCFQLFSPTAQETARLPWQKITSSSAKSCKDTALEAKVWTTWPSWRLTSLLFLGGVKKMATKWKWIRKSLKCLNHQIS